VNNALHVLAQASGDDVTAMIILLVQLFLFVLIIAGMWKVFAKAGQPGWAAIVPFFNLYILCKIAGRPGWWVILFLIPFVNIILFAIVSIDVAKSFGKGALYGVGLWLLGIIFYPILGFGSSEYQGPVAA
jgi:hypothetical protein